MAYYISEKGDSDMNEADFKSHEGKNQSAIVHRMRQLPSHIGGKEKKSFVIG